MKCRLALDSIARRYVPGSIRRGYRTHWATAFHTRGNPPSDGSTPPLAGEPALENRISQTDRPEHDMTQLSPANAERLRQAFQRCRDMEGSLGERLQAYAAAGRDFFRPTARRSIVWSRGSTRTAAARTRRGRARRCRRSCCRTRPAGSSACTSLIGNGPVIVMFYRGHWCPYCRLNVTAIMQAQDEISALGGQIVAIMPETQKYAERFKSEAGAPFPVLTDLDNGYALSLNLAIWLDARSSSCSPIWTCRIFTAMTAACCRFRDLRGRPRRPGESPLRRSRFPQANGDRRTAGCGSNRQRGSLRPR